MKKLLVKLPFPVRPFGADERGPYYKNDLRSRVRRVAECWMPNALHTRLRRIELAIRLRAPLSEVPKVALPLHHAWVTEADMRWANSVARELEQSRKESGDG